ncbi:hypothetical protein [Burkholderia plantarii]|uniref:hypothetical protein n=1 Tax=Burkholderia plantarii TaxID=41899 RepID=UPI00272D28C0|nr:hypothetical protein [Burkholderia plantarii]
MRSRPVPRPVEPAHVLIAFALLVAVTGVLLVPIASADGDWFSDEILPIGATFAIAFTFWAPAMRALDGHDADWELLFGARRAMKNFGLCVYGVALVGLAWYSIRFASLRIAGTHMGPQVCVQTLLHAGLIYLWGFLTLPFVRFVSWLDATCRRRGSR